MVTLKALQRIIQGPNFSALAGNDGAVNKAKAIVQAYYGVTLFLAALRIIWSQPESWMSASAFRPLWGLFWAGSLPFGVIEQTIKYVFLVSAFIGAAWWGSRWGRVMAFVGTWQLVAYIGSFRQPFHHYQWFPWLFASLLFVFLPLDLNTTAGGSRGQRRKTLFIVWSALAFYLLTYMNIFISRLIGVLLQIYRGEINAFTPQGYHLQLAEYTLQQPFVTSFAKFFLASPIYGWGAFMFGMYVYAFSLWAMFRPTLIRLWGFLLFFISTASYLVTTAFYIHHFLFLILLFFETPFLLREPSGREVLQDVPILGWALRALQGSVNQKKA